MINRFAQLKVIGTLALLLCQSLAMSAAGLAASDTNAPASYQHVQEIIVVCKTHFDIGYTHRVKELLDYYRTTMIDRALDLMAASKELPREQQFVWTSPGWVMQKVMEDWPGQTPERAQKLEEAFRSGRFVTHALPFSIEAELIEPEEYARGYAFADAVSRKYGKPMARGAKTTDVPAQSRSLATALAHGGVKFMHIGCNWPAGPVHGLPPIFWWEGPDGSRVLTIYSGAYGTSSAFTSWYDPHDPNLGHNLLPAPNWPYKTWLALIVTGDNSGPPKADGIKNIFAEVAQKMPRAKVRMGTMEEFADAILAEQADIPVVKGEMPDTWIHGCMCDPGGMKTARNIGPLIPVAELLNTQLRGWGVGVGDAAGDLAVAHEKALLYNEHTWGGSESVTNTAMPSRKSRPRNTPTSKGRGRLHPHRGRDHDFGPAIEPRSARARGKTRRSARRCFQSAAVAAFGLRGSWRKTILRRKCARIRLSNVRAARATRSSNEGG